MMSSLSSSGTETGCPSLQRNAEFRNEKTVEKPPARATVFPGRRPEVVASGHGAPEARVPDTPALPREHVLACDGRVGVPEE